MEGNNMARTTCKCGEILSNSSVPNDIELTVYTSEEWDNILQNDTIQTWKIPLPKYDVWKCPKCERIYVFEDGINKAIKIYSLEN